MSITAIGLAAGLVATPALAAEETFFLLFDGAQEIPGPGDPDGSAFGTITLNDITGEVSWNFSYADIAAPSAMHIHTGAAGASGGVFIGLGVTTSGGAGTLIDSLTHAPLSDITSILNSPTDFYVNIHTSEFQPGAIRSQIPAPSALALVSLGGLAVTRRRR